MSFTGSIVVTVDSDNMGVLSLKAGLVLIIGECPAVGPVDKFEAAVMEAQEQLPTAPALTPVEA